MVEEMVVVKAGADKGVAREAAVRAEATGAEERVAAMGVAGTEAGWEEAVREVEAKAPGTPAMSYPRR